MSSAKTPKDTDTGDGATSVSAKLARQAIQRREGAQASADYAARNDAIIDRTQTLKALRLAKEEAAAKEAAEAKAVVKAKPKRKAKVAP